MALTALEIYKHLKKTNCGECGSPTCLAFAMQLASKKASLDACPYVTDEARAVLDGASAPPIKLITIGAGDRKFEVGNETVLFRHDETFYHETGIVIEVSDKMAEADLVSKADPGRSLRFSVLGRRMLSSASHAVEAGLCPLDENRPSSGKGDNRCHAHTGVLFRNHPFGPYQTAVRGAPASAQTR